MVQGLAFLSKKSWHTKNLVNQEKVWVAEQRKAAEEQKTKELAKQITQEREQEEFDKLAGKTTIMDRGIDWMYQGGTNGELAKEDAEKHAEDFLLGKEFVAEGATTGDFDNGDKKTGIHNIIGTEAAASAPPTEASAAAAVAAAGQPYEPSFQDRNKEFRMRVEDPMFLVSQKQRAKEVKHEQTKALYERVVGYQEKPENGDNDNAKTKTKIKEDVAERKRAKKERKLQKKKNRSRRDGDEDDDRKRGHRHRSRSASKERSHKHRRRERSRSRTRSRSRSNSNSPSPSRSHISECSRDYDTRRDDRSRHHHREERSSRRRHSEVDRKRRGRDEDRRRDDDRKRDSNRRRRYSEDDKSGEDRYHRRREDRRYDRNDDKYHDESSRKKGPSHHQHHEHNDDRHHGREEQLSERDKQRDKHPPSVRKQEGYGLKGAPAAAKHVNKNDLGPNRELLQKKRDERDAQRRRIRETASSRRRTTGDARVKALQEMQSDARARETNMTKQASHKATHNHEEDEPSKAGAAFLTDMTKETHGISGKSSSLSSRVAQNRHTNQKLHDSFL